MSVRLLTFNIYGSYCKNYYKFEPIVDSLDIDIICTQESYNLNNPKTKKNKHIARSKYKLFGRAGYGGVISGILGNSDKGIVQEDIKEIFAIDTVLPEVSHRYGIIFSYNGIKIANLHLEGGRYIDLELLDQTKSTVLIDYKISLLQKIIERKPDVICGDFNSVWSSNKKTLERYLDQQYIYFYNILKYQGKLSAEELQTKMLNDQNKTIINNWNLKPYKLLCENGYVYAKPDNENSAITNGRGQTIVDTIWYNPKTVLYSGGYIINIISPDDDYWQSYNCISDHNPVFAEFTKLDGYEHQPVVNISYDPVNIHMCHTKQDDINNINIRNKILFINPLLNGELDNIYLKRIEKLLTYKFTPTNINYFILLIEQINNLNQKFERSQLYVFFLKDDIINNMLINIIKIVNINDIIYICKLFNNIINILDIRNIIQSKIDEPWSTYTPEEKNTLLYFKQMLFIISIEKKIIFIDTYHPH